MKRLLALATVVAALAAPAAAWAHPLGNFTINRYSRVALSGDRVYVLYVLDMAEIPTFQARPLVKAQGTEGYARRTSARLLRHVSLVVGGRPVALRELRHALAFPPGQAGLRTTRLEVVYGSEPIAGGSLQLSYRDDNFAGRIGWREIVVRADSGARLRSASVPATSASAELRTYPKDLLQSPLDVTSARASFSPGTGAGSAPATRSGRALDARVGVRAVADGGFAALIGRDRLPVGVVLLSLLIATFWGAAHALTPGHGKSIIAAYLVGTRGTRRDAVVLGLTVTATHTIGVFALGLITLSLSQYVVPEDLYPWLNLTSALLVVAVGLGVLGWRLRDWRGQARGHHHDHDDHDHGHHHHDHDHDHDDHDHGHHGHHHHHHHDDRDRSAGPRGLLGVGISGGLIPCPTALVVLLAAISLHRIGYGLVLILAFSVGLAAAMTAIGLVAVTAKRAFERVDFEAGVIRLVPAVSALAILGLGVAMTARALTEVM